MQPDEAKFARERLAMVAHQLRARDIDDERVLKVIVYVASHEGFVNQHKAANGASELLKEVFGEAGRHARAAVGVAYLPLDATVEVDITFRVKP